MCRSMVDIQSPTAEIRRGIKKDTKKDTKKPEGKNIMSTSPTQGGHKKLDGGDRKNTQHTVSVLESCTNM